MYGAYGQWSVLHELAAAVVDTLQLANWQRGGGRGARPRRVPRPRPPGVEDPNVTRVGSAVSRDALDRMLGWEVPEDGD